MSESLLTFQFDEKVFLDCYWQRRPLLIKAALPNWQSPLSPEELGGLAFEEDADSRLISKSKNGWMLKQGPLVSEDFQRSDDWTLLVNGVDHWVPEVAALRQCLRFLPQWRFDDVMVSYAVADGGVGPHFDRYDVFLVQGTGRRKWRLGGWCDENTPRIKHEGLNLLQNFETSEEYLLEAGDVLYVPPGLAHWGVADTPCMTYSLGFRAPTVAALLARWADKTLESVDPELLLEDRASVTNPPRPGEITLAHWNNAREAIRNSMEALDDGSWLGEVVTEHGECAPPPSKHATALRLHAGARVSWQALSNECSVYANGEALRIPLSSLPILERLCSGDTVSPHELTSAHPDFLNFLAMSGVLVGLE
ncbi:MAG: cupin domain-containing protein [Halieaceae bacterium]|nr:cupin domain-containing protein [Halieaceae bacterium]